MTRRRAAVATAVLASAALAVGIVAAVRSTGEERSASAGALEACARASDAERDACFAREFTAVARRGGVAHALATLERLVDRGLLDDCHLHAHAVAHAAVAVLGVDRAFRLATGHCRLGYLHGAAEMAAAPAGGAAAARPGAHCRRFGSSDFAASCWHGFGHALVRSHRGTLSAMFGACRRGERFGVHVLACQEGVAMQHSLRYAGLPEDAFRREASRGCADLAGPRLRETCYRNVGVVAALTLGHDRAEASSLCRGLESTVSRRQCLTGVREEIEEARS